MQLAQVNWEDVADVIRQLLTQVYSRNKLRFKKEAKRRGISLEQLAAAAITEMLRNQIEEPGTNGRQRGSV